MSFILLVFMFSTPPGYIPAGFAEEFDTEVACNNAGAAYLNIAKTLDPMLLPHIDYVCVPKR